MLVFDSVSSFNEYYGHETRHPLVNVLDLSKSGRKQRQHTQFGLYLVVYKKIDDPASRLRYGLNHYDFQDGTLLFFAPGQSYIPEAMGEWYQPKSSILAFHADLIAGTSLENKMHKFGYFSYASHEALHVDNDEKKLVFNIFENISNEINSGNDSHSLPLVIANIELLLKYCTRFYSRQNDSRTLVHSELMERFDQLLVEFLVNTRVSERHLPTVAYFAKSLHLSPNYFGDLVKYHAGIPAQEYIHRKLIDAAKDKILSTNSPIGVIADELGFKYAQHFTRLFKQRTGYSPNAFRKKFVKS